MGEHFHGVSVSVCPKEISRRFYSRSPTDSSGAHGVNRISQGGLLRAALGPRCQRTKSLQHGMVGIGCVSPTRVGEYTILESYSVAGCRTWFSSCLFWFEWKEDGVERHAEQGDNTRAIPEKFPHEHKSAGRIILRRETLHARGGGGGGGGGRSADQIGESQSPFR
jgi:hypothetical protein